MTDVRSVDQRLTDTAPKDQRAAHDRFATGMRGLADQVYAAFDLEPHAASIPNYASADGAMRGTLKASSGGDLDWVIDSWVGSPERGFTNHHLTLWVGDRIAVPHLGLAIGTIPQLFCFCDLVPRSDLWVDTDTLDRYYEPFNERYMAVAADERFRPFISREVYIREAISPIGLCIEGEPTRANIDSCLGYFAETLQTWIGWVKEAPEVPLEDRARLGARDALMRKTICERDPANIVAEKVLGADLTNQLVRTLSGAVRQEV